MKIFRFLITLLAAASCVAPQKVRAQGMINNKSQPLQVAPQKALDVTDEVTLEAWIQADTMPKSGGRILDKSVPGTNQGYLLDTHPGTAC